MSHYRTFVEAVADGMQERDETRVPLTALTSAEAQGFEVTAFESDVEEELEHRNTSADPRQTDLPFA